MKGRSVKLKEAHSSSAAAAAANCSILWDPSNRHVITASASDPVVSVHRLDQPSDPPKSLRHHRDGVTALALSPSSAALASGSVDHSVKLYSFPDVEFQTNITRFTLPIRSLAFNKSGSLLAAAGDDDGIKLVATIDSSISRVLKGHDGPVTGLAFDPLNEYLASVDAFGTVIYWELSSGKPIHTLRAVAPNCGSDTSLLNVVAWSPDGETLAVPGLKNDVVMYDRDTAEKLFSLKGDHERPVCFFSWSPNGKYVATSGLDSQVLIWDVDLRQDIERQKFDDRISCLAWKPTGNALAVIDVMGKFGVWESAVPSCMKSPSEGAPSLQAKNADGICLFDDDDDDEKPSISGSLDDVEEESHGESAPISRKRLRKQSVLHDSLDEDSDGQGGLLRQTELRKRSSVKREKHTCEKEESVTSMKFSRPKLQESFQPGSTPVQAGKRRFLSYNMLGCITTIENEGYSHIEVDFHDTGRGPRVPSMTDYFGFTMASLNEYGSIFASLCKGEKNMSTLMYRPFSSWANNSEWSMRFDAEEVKAVALGTGWVAAVTSLNFLRIFTEGGLQKHILCLDGPVVAAAGFGEKLAVITHASDCLPSGDQVLDVNVFNISAGTRPIRCRLPLTPSTSLTWFGFSEEGLLAAYDSKGVLRVQGNQFGGSWLPLFSASRARKSEDENYWVVGLNASNLFCIVCKSPDYYPSVMPKPVLTLLSLSFPLACSDLGVTDLENEFMMCNLYLSQTKKKIEEMAAEGLDTTVLDDDAFNMEATLDRCILRIIANCCNGDKLVRAAELARLLSLNKSVKGAIKLVTALKLPNLAERFNEILEERLSNESIRVAAFTPLASGDAITNNLPSMKASAPPEIYKAAEPVTVLSAPSLPHNLSNQGKTDVKVNKESNLSNTSPSGALNKHQKMEESVKIARVTEVCQTRKEKDLKDGITPKPCRNTREESLTDGGSHRPVNPFAKVSNNQNKSSLLDSIKKMKKVDGEVKDQRTAIKK